jgi:hypothetical protein
MTARPSLHACDERAERAVLGAVLADGGIWPDLSETVKRDDLFVERHKAIYDACLELQAANIPIDLTTLTRALNGRLESIGGAVYLYALLLEINEGRAVLSNWPAYAAAVVEKAEERRRAAAGLEASRAFQQGDLSAAGQILIAAAEQKETPQPIGLVGYPPLPAEAWIDPDQGLGAGSWIDLYVEHAAAVSPMTPRLFHEAAALVLGSIVIARRLRVRMSYADIYPNLFVVFNAPTTLFAKTTAMDYARHKAREVAPHLLAARDSTIEALLSDMAGIEPTNFHTMTEEDRAHWQAGRNFAAQRGVFADELSALLSAAGRDYNSGLIETYLKFFDCDDFYTRSTRAQGRVNVRGAYLSMLGASTPGALAAHLNTDRLWANGWWARFALLTPDTDRPAWVMPEERDEPPELIGALKILYDRFEVSVWPKPPKAVDVMLGAGVFEVWAAYNKAMRFELLTPELPERLWGVYGRLPTQVLKVATILAALDWGSEPAPVIDLPHIARAVSIVESWRVSAHRVVAAADQNDYTAMRGRLMRILSKAGPRGATMRDIGRAMRDKTPSEIEMTLDQMVDIGDAVLMDSKPGQSGGRPTRRYRVP